MGWGWERIVNVLKARMEKINLTRWNLTAMRSPLLRPRKTNCSRSGWGRDGLTTSHGKKAIKGFRWLEAKCESMASCGYSTKQNKALKKF